MNNRLNNELNKIERRSREWNVRLLGVREETWIENCKETVAKIIADKKLLGDLGKDEIRDKIENARRTGRRGEKPRHIIVKLDEKPDRNEILRRNKQHLTG